MLLREQLFCSSLHELSHVGLVWEQAQLFTMKVFHAFLLCFLRVVAGQDLLTLNIIATNPPKNALTIVLATAATYIDILLDAQPLQYIWLQPGEAIPDTRKRRLSELGPVESKREEEEKEVVIAPSQSIRGSVDRSLQMRSCPTTCAKSSSTSCKQLGCAYCGTKCRRRMRALLLTSNQAKLIESTINLLLRPLCGFKLGCSIISKIYRVDWVNGTAVQTPLVK